MLWRAIVGRLGLSIVTLWVVSVLIFVGTNLLPGDIAQIMLPHWWPLLQFQFHYLSD